MNIDYDLKLEALERKIGELIEEFKEDQFINGYKSVELKIHSFSAVDENEDFYNFSSSLTPY